MDLFLTLNANCFLINLEKRFWKTSTIFTMMNTTIYPEKKGTHVFDKYSVIITRVRDLDIFVGRCSSLTGGWGGDNPSLGGGGQPFLLGTGAEGNPFGGKGQPLWERGEGAQPVWGGWGGNPFWGPFFLVRSPPP